MRRCVEDGYPALERASTLKAARASEYEKVEQLLYKVMYCIVPVVKSRLNDSGYRPNGRTISGGKRS